MSQSVIVAEKQEGCIVQYTKFDMLNAQRQAILPGFSRVKAPFFAQVNAREIHQKLTRKVDRSIMVSRRNQGFHDLEQLCEQVIAEGNSVIAGFVIAERGGCVQFCCLVGGLPRSFPLRRDLTTPCD